MSVQLPVRYSLLVMSAFKVAKQDFKNEWISVHE